MREDPGQSVQEAVQGGAEQGDQGRDQSPGWRHHRPTGKTLTVSLHTLSQADVPILIWDKLALGARVPLGGGHHLGHGGQEVPAADGDGVDV